MSEQRPITILFADIAGSTKLFETRGDVEARALTSQVLNALTQITLRHSGTVIKTIGDEIMCTFPGPSSALHASVDMQRRVAGDLAWARDHLAIRIGLHHGEALIEDSLKQLEDEFPERFIRIHRNALAAVAHITGIEKDNLGHCYLKLRHSDEKLEISRRLLPDVRRHLKN